MIGIYKITSPTNKVYIGQSVDIKRRWNEHRTCKELGLLQNSIKKHGFENHIFEILEECEIELLNERERFYQDQFDVLGPMGLNLVLTNTDNKKQICSQETKDKISKFFKGRKLTVEHKLKIGKASLGKIFTEESRKKVSLSNKGRVHSEEIKKKNSERNLGKVMSKESRDKISLAFKGKPKSEDTKFNMKLAWIKRKQDKLNKSQDEGS